MMDKASGSTSDACEFCGRRSYACRETPAEWEEVYPPKLACPTCFRLLREQRCEGGLEAEPLPNCGCGRCRKPHAPTPPRICGNCKGPLGACWCSQPIEPDPPPEHHRTAPGEPLWERED